MDANAKVRRLLLELQLHQTELEAQNSELRRVQAELEASLARYTEIYDNAPAAYLTLDARGRIARANHAAAALLRVPRPALGAMTLSRFVALSSNTALVGALERIRGDRRAAQLELQIQPAEADSLLSVRLELSPDTAPGAVRIVLIDVTAVRAEAAQNAARIEQGRLRADLHDGLGQELAGLSLSLRALQRRAEAAGSPDATEFQQLTAIATHAIGSCHSIVRGLSPVSEHEGGLLPALAHLVEWAQVAGGPKVSLMVTGSSPIRLPLAAADHLYRIAQESLNNALKHSHAQSVRVSIEARRESLRLEVADNGVGFVPETPLGSGIGLRVMRHRAFSIGARLSIHRAKSGGTSIRCVCPQPAAAGRAD